MSTTTDRHAGAAPVVDPDDLLNSLERLAASGMVRLEHTAGIPTWEPMPGLRHQRAVDRVRATIVPAPGAPAGGCGCHHVADVLIRFPDGSFRRPDIAIFCSDPPDTDEALDRVPDAVVEVLSPGYERKDTEIGAPFYLAQGVADVVLVDPRSGAVTHHTAGGTQELVAPATLGLRCGCRLSV